MLGGLPFSNSCFFFRVVGGGKGSFKFLRKNLLRWVGFVFWAQGVSSGVENLSPEAFGLVKKRAPNFC